LLVGSTAGAWLTKHRTSSPDWAGTAKRETLAWN
jgi:hypothetical protein